ISANDTSDNWNETGVITLGVLDNDAPSIVDNSPGLATTGDAYTFNASVVDNIGVRNVTLTYWFGAGAKVTVDMVHRGGGYYEYTIVIPANSLDTLHYNISANDTSDNRAWTGQKDVTVVDNDAPSLIINITISQYMNKLDNISGNATDNYNITAVKIRVYNETGAKYWNGSGWQSAEVWVDASTNVTLPGNEVRAVDWWYDFAKAGITWTNGHTYNITVMAIDSAGNNGTDMCEFTFDNQAPDSSVGVITPYWRNSKITINISATETISSITKVQLWYYNSTDNSTWSGPWLFGENTTGGASYGFTFTFPNGTGYYRFYSIAYDKAGNVESAPVTNDTMCCYDTIAPVTTNSSVAEWYNKSATITLTAMDDLSGVRATYYKMWRSGNTEPSTWTEGTIVEVKDDGIWNVAYYSVDKANNSEEKHTIVVRVDMTPPTVTDRTGVNKVPANGTVVIKAEVSDNLAQDMSVILYYEISHSSPSQYTSHVTMTYNSSSGYFEATIRAGTDATMYIYYKICATDSAGNMGVASGQIDITSAKEPKLMGIRALPRATVNTTVPITIELYDEFYNMMEYPVLVQLSVLMGNGTLEKESVTITGSGTVNYRLGIYAIPNSIYISVSPQLYRIVTIEGVADKVVAFDVIAGIITNNTQPTIITEVNESQEFIVEVLAIDRYGNINLSYACTLLINTTDEKADINSTILMTDGIAMFNATLYSLGEQWINVSDSAHPEINGSILLIVHDITPPTINYTIRGYVHGYLINTSPVVFDATNSTDNGRITSYLWRILRNNVVVVELHDAVNSTTLGAGTYSVMLNLTDEEGNKNSTTFNITVMLDTDGDKLANIIDDDDDNDGMNDTWEEEYNLDPLDSSDAAVDSDNDGLTNYQEFLNNTYPNDVDSDDDGMPDGWEVKYKPNLDPTENDASLDADGDGFTNLEEYTAGTNPLDPSDHPTKFNYYLLIALIIVIAVIVAVLLLVKRKKKPPVLVEEAEEEVEGLEEAEEAEEGEFIECPTCGAIVPADVTVCPECGERLVEEE
ncbi:MAG: hypothetical protein DRN20_04455, partial [Thermoplasmata archaeon]